MTTKNLVQVTDQNFETTVGASLDVDANPITASKFGVLSIPSLILFRNGKPAERIVGYKPKAYLKQKIDAVL